MSNDPITVRELRALLSDIPGETWVCLAEGPVNDVVIELGANEPFVMLLSNPHAPRGGETENT